MRADAARNVEKLRVAAAELFRANGLHVSLREIAGHAGVSHGTLYNLFGSREALINEVVTDIAAERLAQVCKKSLTVEDPWLGFVQYVETLCEIQVAEPVIADVLSGRYPEAGALMALCAEAGADSVRIIERAQESGQLRSDFTGEDLALTIGAVAALARAGAGVAPDAWKRSMAFVLDGLRSGSRSTELDVSTLTPQQVYATLGALQTRG